MAKVRIGGSMSPKLDEFVRHYAAGSVFFREGELGSEMFIIQSGQVAISRMINGQERELAVFEKGDFFGEMALLDEFPERSATAKAVTRTEVLQLRSADFDDLLRRKPDIALRMLGKLSERLRESNRRLEETLGKQAAKAAAVAPGSPGQGVLTEAVLYHDEAHLAFALRLDADTSVGRHDPITGVTPDVDLTSLDPERTVSRRHAMLRVADHSLSVTETNASTNGTFVNGVKLAAFAPQELKHGDVLQFALVTLRVHIFSTPG